MWVFKRRYLCILFIYLVLLETCASLILESCAVAAMYGAVAWMATSYYNSYRERQICASISLDYDGFKRDLSSKLHGQHLVIPTVLRSIKTHYKDPDPGKPLVLSFHGWTGGGKNFVSQLIKDNLYKNEAEIHFHLFNSEIHFKHESKVEEYKDQLHSWIYHNVSNCGRSMFVFDEMDHMPAGIIDVLTPFLSHNTQIDGVDFRKSVFIFLSNTGGDEIAKIVYKHWQNSKIRESLRLSDMQQPLELVAYNEKSGLKRSKLLHKNLIDHFVPFLPLEREHVRKCIIDLLQRKNIRYDEDFIKEVLNQLSWQPKGIDLFSKSGCKKIESLVAIMSDD